MTPLQQLVAMSIPAIASLPTARRAELLDAAADHLPQEMAEICRAQAVCLRQSDKYQLTLSDLLNQALPTHR